MTRVRSSWAGDDVARVGDVGHGDLAMRCNRCQAEEEWLRLLLVLLDSLIKEVIRHVGNEIGAVLVLVDLTQAIVVEKTRVQVVVGERVKQNLRAGPPGGIRVIEVDNRKIVQKLAGVVGVVACFLKEDGEIPVVQPFRLPFWPPAYDAAVLLSPSCVCLFPIGISL
jgi:hypothetical protein